ncbi:MAG: type II toxin-antitoxin system HipA family toxin [Deltaproteobacteria bacterium]|nr:MAG: type II toxin-antitoxin system HipA family toxin [Deltaproteobacteria bacterium]TMQ19982.1 MAG: type II toxin-antitoxin system HipA family toxin [Deltaproteobacteria bacterium]
MELRVLLGTVDVGVIRSERDGRTEFAFSPDYLASGRRPVLGQYFEDHLDEAHRSQTYLPPFFSNLLPEGGLRELIAQRAGVHRDREPDLLALLGEDLPGAVIVRRSDDADSGREEHDASPAVSDPPVGDEPLRFSLAGAQLKFSVLYRAGTRGPTVPVDGRGGNWIAKLPSEAYPRVPENEYEMMQWAGRVGIAVPETELVTVGDMEGLPIQLDPRSRVFLSRRFDRPESSSRIHQEDFAQVANVRAAARYGTLSSAGIARIVRAVAGEDDFDEVIRRLAFNVLIGNGDAHLKNWSLTYPDGVRARLSPAYDLVATVSYSPADKLGLKLSRENRFDRIRAQHFERLADHVGVARDRVLGIVGDTVRRAMASWPEAPLDPQRIALIREHAERLPLVRDAG